MEGERQRRHTELDRLRAAITKRISEDATEEYEGGVVSRIPITQTPLYMSDHWSQKNVFCGPSFDIWNHKASEGAEIPYHKTPDHDIVLIMHRGSIKIKVQDKVKELSEGDIISIDRGNKFGLKALEDAEIFLIYYPPIGYRPDDVVVGPRPNEDTTFKRILYHSKAVDDFDSVDTVVSSRSRNAEHHITGVMFYDERTGNIVQFIEGPEEEINQLYENIQEDSRHYSIRTLIEQSSDHKLAGYTPMFLSSVSIDDDEIAAQDGVDMLDKHYSRPIDKQHLLHNMQNLRAQ